MSKSGSVEFEVICIHKTFSYCACAASEKHLVEIQTNRGSAVGLENQLILIFNFKLESQRIQRPQDDVLSDFVWRVEEFV